MIFCLFFETIFYIAYSAEKTHLCEFVKHGIFWFMIQVIFVFFSGGWIFMGVNRGGSSFENCLREILGKNLNFLSWNISWNFVWKIHWKAQKNFKINFQLNLNKNNVTKFQEKVIERKWKNHILGIFLTKKIYFK
jgi:hypothetical protein